jgi:hypothetical protein
MNMANTPQTPSRPGDKPTPPSKDRPGTDRPATDRPSPSNPQAPRKDKDDKDDDDVAPQGTSGELATEVVTGNQQRVYLERGRAGGPQRTGVAGDIDPADDPSLRTTRAGRAPKSPTPGLAAEPYNTDPSAWDPRFASEGTPIAFPDPDEPYPQEGTPYPPPVGTAMRVGEQAARALDPATGKRLDAEGKVVEETGPRVGQTAAASGEANLGGKPSRQFDTP